MISLITTFLFLSAYVVLAQNGDMHDQHPLSEDSEIGEINFRVDCSDEVRKDFNQAVGMLHHMMYETARSLFGKVANAEPDCAMAYWGISTTLFQPLWGTRPGEEDLKRGWRNIEKARELVNSDREKKLIESTAGFFKEPETTRFRTRIERWADGMENAYEAYPEDPEIATFYSLSRLTLAQHAADRAPFHDEAEKILGDIYKKNPTHPGAIHYSIHATDVDGRAGNALDRVKAYSRIAPDNPHALHMPSHIYVRQGDWPRVIEWNLKSAEAALKHSVNGEVSHHYIHAIDYLVYAYLQRGEDEKAEGAYEEALNKDRYQSSFISSFHYAATPARLAVEQRDWQRATNLTPRSPEYLPWDESPWAESLTWYARGLGAAYTGDTGSAQKAETKMKELQQTAMERGDADMAAYIKADRHVLSGRIAYANGEYEKALSLMQKATEIEQSVEKHPVTPGALLPANEALGDLLMDLGRPEKALRSYEKSNQIWPGRLNTLMGAALAAKINGNQKLLRQFVETLVQHGSTNLDPPKSAPGQIVRD